MSLLGFDAIGRAALGQLPKSFVVTLPALQGTFTETGEPVTFKTTFAVAEGGFAETGFAATFGASFGVGFGSFAETGKPIAVSVTFAAAKGAFVETGFASTATNGSSPSLTGHYVVTGFAVNELVLEAAGFASYAITGNAATLDRDFVNWFPQPVIADEWSASASPSGAWTPASQPGGAWAANRAMSIPLPESE